MSENEPMEDVEAIAVIGLACRFPGADDVEIFWKNLCDGVSSVVRFTDEDLLAYGEDPALIAHPDYVKVGSTPIDIESFDAAFFQMSPKEATATDPQHRLFLECAWEALENAGWDPAAFDGRIGVFAGSGFNTYLLRNLVADEAFIRSLDDYQIGIGNNKDFVATRVSYQFGLKGPGVNVGTACSTSLTAVHLACQSLLSYSCDMALAGAVTLRVPQRRGYLYQEGGIPSPDGICRPFDAKAKGTLNSSGAGTVLLKRLEDALADGDKIWAVIRGTAINNDGSDKVGFTAPGVEGQAEVIAEAHAVAGVEPETIDYVEAHGTGTSIGDPIEIEALNQAFAAVAGKPRSCPIGSVKSNIGHTDTASGMAGLIKTVLAIHHKTLPPSLHFNTPNPRIDFAGGPFYVNDQVREWPAGKTPRRAGVSSFGIGGTNVHLVLEEAPDTPARTFPDPDRGLHLLTLSAKTASALDHETQNLFKHFKCNPETDLADAAYTLQTGRKAFGHRRVLICDGFDKDQGLAPVRVLSNFNPPGSGRVAFMFPGQGVQHVNMGREIYEREPVFREILDQCADGLMVPLGLDIRQLIYPEPKEEETAHARLTRTEFAQPAIFAVSYAMARLWMSWGISPRSMIGYSIGEYVAACIAGVFSLPDVLALVALRGSLIQDASPGTHKMDPVVARFQDELEKLSLSPPDIPFVSNVTGDWITKEQAIDPAYWARHLRTTVRFDDGIQTLFSTSKDIFLETGPGTTLLSFVTQRPDRPTDLTVIASMRHPQDPQSDEAFLLTALANVWLAGALVNWKAFHGRNPRCRVPLPTYPFERRRFWVEPPLSRPLPPPAETAKADPDVRLPFDQWFNSPIWRPSPCLPAQAPAPTSWLILADDQGWGERIARRLETAGHSVVQAAAADHSFHDPDANRHAIDTRNGEDIDRLIADLAQSKNLPARVLHLWSLLKDTNASDSLEQSQTLGFDSLLFLSQALGRHAADHPIRIDVVADAVHAITGRETQLHPLSALLLGPVRTIPQEYPNIRCRLIDADLEEDAKTLLDHLMGELSGDIEEGLAALRENQRWTQTFEPVSPKLIENKLRQEGVYLITGGLGGIGSVIARHLAESVRAKLVLTSRSALPDKTAWDEWQAALWPSDPVSVRIQQVRDLEALGAEVLVMGADAADLTAMRSVVRETFKRFGAVNGVIHAAGLPSGGVIQLKNQEDAHRTLAPKVQGTLALDAAIGDAPLDFFLLCSSLTSVVGGFGQVDYCAANAFLDAFAQARYARTGQFTVSVNWDTWQEVGMAVAAASGRMETQEKGKSQKAKGKRKDNDDQPSSFIPKIEKTDHPLFQWRVLPCPDQEIRVSRFRSDDVWMLNEHLVMGNPTLPGTAYLEMAYMAFCDGADRPPGRVVLEDVYLLSPLSVADGEEKAVQTVLRTTDKGAAFSILSRGKNGAEWREHAKGRIKRAGEEQESVGIDIRAIADRCQKQADTPTQELGNGAIRFGPRWACRKEFHIGKDEALVRLELPEPFVDDLLSHPLHPALLDMAGASLGHWERFEGLPFHYRRMTVFKPLSRTLFSHIRRVREDGSDPGEETVQFDATITDETGDECLQIKGYALKRVRTPQPAENFALQIDTPGDLDTLRFRPALRKKPGPGEVEIKVTAVGLNFKEALYAAGALPGPLDGAVQLGMECAGRVESVGEGVTDFLPGDAVTAFAPGSFGAYLVTPVAMTAPLPKSLDFEDGAAAPVAFMTAYYALVRLGRLAAGEQVLIHAASGGVGMAAVSIAQWIGAEIFATAGSPEKREFLRSCGIRHVMNSRSLDFADEVMAATKGKGVNVVLNSLSGPYIPKGLSILAPYGRFLELGVKDIHENAPLGLKFFEKNLSFFAIDLNPDLPDFTDLFRKAMELLDSGDLSPLPKQVFSVRKVKSAFELMIRAGHIGKIVVSMADRASAVEMAMETIRLEESDEKISARGAAVRATAFQDEFIRKGIHPSDGVRAFSVILAGFDDVNNLGTPLISQVAVSPRNLKTRIAREGKAILERIDGQKPAGQSGRRPQLQQAYAAPENEIEAALAQIWQELLGIDPIGVEDDFFELGGDSLLAVQAISRIKDRLGTDLGAGILFEAPTISALARVLASKARE